MWEDILAGVDAAGAGVRWNPAPAIAPPKLFKDNVPGRIQELQQGIAQQRQFFADQERQIQLQRQLEQQRQFQAQQDGWFRPIQQPMQPIEIRGSRVGSNPQPTGGMEIRGTSVRDPETGKSSSQDQGQKERQQQARPVNQSMQQLMPPSIVVMSQQAPPAAPQIQPVPVPQYVPRQESTSEALPTRPQSHEVSVNVNPPPVRFQPNQLAFDPQVWQNSPWRHLLKDSPSQDYFRFLMMGNR